MDQVRPPRVARLSLPVWGRTYQAAPSSVWVIVTPVFSRIRPCPPCPARRPDRPRLDTGPTAQVVQACACVLAETGHYLAAGPWHEPAGLPRLHALAPAAVLCIGPADDPGLRAALASLEIPIVETWATPAGPLDSAVLYANIDTGRLAARHSPIETMHA